MYRHIDWYFNELSDGRESRRKEANSIRRKPSGGRGSRRAVESMRVPTSRLSGSFALPWAGVPSENASQRCLSGNGGTLSKGPREVSRKTGTSLGFAVELFQRTRNAEVLSREADNIEICPSRFLSRQISFISTCPYILASWIQISSGFISDLGDDCFRMLNQIANCEVANRPGRLEPGLIKQRPKPHKLMQKPRNERREQLRKDRK